MKYDQPEIIDDYAIGIELGQGGMKRVWHATSTKDGKVVALAMMLQRFPGAELESRFHRECETLLRLNHPHIVKILKVGMYKASPYFVMELMEESVFDYIGLQGMEVRQAFDFILPICSGVAYANAQGILHRDIKPSNMLLDSQGGAKIADFGLAKIVHDLSSSQPAQALTRLQQGLGTPPYASPEQARGDWPAVSQASEVYSLGVSLVEMLLGQSVLKDAESTSLTDRFENEVARRRNTDSEAMPADVADIVVKAIHPDPSHRYPTVEELRMILEDIRDSGELELPQYARDKQSESDDDLREILREAAQQQITPTSKTQDAVEGQLIGGKFRLETPAGQGGEGEVWKAVDVTSPGRFVALKFLPKHLRHNTEVAGGLLDNFAQIDKLQHSNICPLKEHGNDSVVGNYLVMRWIDGLTLAQHIQRRRSQGRFFDVAEVYKVLYAIANALDEIHQQTGITHRDIKPANLIISSTKIDEPKQARQVDNGGKTWLVDFGLAKEIHNSVTQERVQRGPAGTPKYMPPEAWLGQQFTAASDQYSLGVVTYEMLGGRTPFESEPNIEAATCNQLPPALTLPKPVNDVLQRVLSKRPEDRFESCSAFIEALLQSVRDPHDRQPTTNAISRIPQSYTMAGIVAAVCFAVIGMVVWPQIKDNATQVTDRSDDVARSFPNGVDTEPSKELKVEKSELKGNEQPDAISETSRIGNGEPTSDPAIGSDEQESKHSQEPNPEPSAYERGMALLDLNQNEQAIEEFKKAIIQDPNNAEAYIQRGVAYRRLRQDNLAIADFGQAHEIEPENVTAILYRGNVYQATGKVDKAIEDYARVIELDPTSAKAFYGYGRAMSSRALYFEAVDYFSQAIKHDPMLSEAYEYRGRAEVERERFDIAIRDFEKAIELDEKRSYLKSEITKLQRIKEDEEK